jgi:uroporphyrinogen-III synthase
VSGALTGLTVLLTRDGGLAEALHAVGAEVRVAPVTRYEAVEVDVDPAGFDWIVFTSARAVAHWTVPLPPEARIACVGPATAEAVRARGREPDRVPERHDAEALADGRAAATDLVGARVLFPCSDLARPTIEERLGAAGATVVRAECYRTVPADALPPAAREGADVVVFLSPSAVEAFAALGGEVGDATALAIGPTTAEAIESHGWSAVTAPTADRDGIVAALERLAMEIRR